MIRTTEKIALIVLTVIIFFFHEITYVLYIIVDQTGRTLRKHQWRGTICNSEEMCSKILPHWWLVIGHRSCRVWVFLYRHVQFGLGYGEVFGVAQGILILYWSSHLYCGSSCGESSFTNYIGVFTLVCFTEMYIKRERCLCNALFCIQINIKYTNIHIYTNIHTYIHTYRGSYIHSGIQTYKHTFIHTL